MLDRRVKVDIITNLHWNAHRHRVAFHEEAIGLRVAQPIVAAGTQEVSETLAQRAPNDSSGGKQRIENRRLQQLGLAAIIEQTGLRDRMQVENLVADRDADPLHPALREDTKGKILNWEIALRRDWYPRLDHGDGRMPSATRSSTGSAKLQLP